MSPSPSPPPVTLPSGDEMPRVGVGTWDIAGDTVRENFELFDWKLDPEDRRRLDEADRNHPVYDTPANDWTDGVYGISE